MFSPAPGSVSVVLCTYNGAAYLDEQLDSIAGQTLLPLELIACDDGSMDTTIEILENFQRRAPFPVTIIQNPTNLGSTANFDQGMQCASAEYVALSDQDDVWFSEKLATLVPMLEADPTLGAVFSDARILDSRMSSSAHGHTQTLWSKHGFNSEKQKTFASKDKTIELLLKADVVTGATMLVRSSLRSLWHPIPHSWVHDGWLTWMVAVHARILPVAQPLMMYRLHQEQQLGVGTDGTFGGRVKAMQNERARYARVAAQFEDLLMRLQSTGIDRELEDRVKEKVALLRRRSELPHNAIARLVVILKAARAYQSYARGWRSMRKDLFLA